jgi:threonylcarbamoyladenosine tRNA methylthiotransferase MtaB
MPPVAQEVVHARARRLRAAGEAALARHLGRQIGREVNVLVERPGRGRAEDFTDIAFDGAPASGTLIRGRIGAHDGARARLVEWRAAS